MDTRNSPFVVFGTPRLRVRLARPTDADVRLLVSLWNDPRVMANVGFPGGLHVTEEQVRRQLEGNVAGMQEDTARGAVAPVPGVAASPLDRRLVAERVEDGALIGECKVGSPDAEGVAHTDVKLLPEYWRRGYGTEIKRGLLDWLFTHTPCRGVRATPNVANVASQRMQAAVGGEAVRRDVFPAARKLAADATDVEFIEYVVCRSVWERRQRGSRGAGR